MVKKHLQNIFSLEIPYIFIGFLPSWWLRTSEKTPPFVPVPCFGLTHGGFESPPPDGRFYPLVNIPKTMERS
jgi:hypothetical protein